MARVSVLFVIAIALMTLCLSVAAVDPVEIPPGLQVALGKSAWQQLFEANAHTLTDDTTFNLSRVNVQDFSHSDVVKVTSIKITNPVAELKDAVSPKMGQFFRCEYRNQNLLFDATFDVAYRPSGGQVFESKVTFTIDLQTSYSVAIVLLNSGQYSPEYMFPRVGQINNWTAKWENNSIPSNQRTLFEQAFIKQNGKTISIETSLHIAAQMQFSILRSLSNVYKVDEYPVAPLGLIDYRATERAFSVHNTTAVFSYNGDITGNDRRASRLVPRFAVPTPQGEADLELVIGSFFLNSRLKTLQVHGDAIYIHHFTVRDFEKSWPELLSAFPFDRKVQVLSSLVPIEGQEYNSIATTNGKVEITLLHRLEFSVIENRSFPSPEYVLNVDAFVTLTLHLNIGPHTRNEFDRDVHFPLRFALNQSIGSDSLVGFTPSGIPEKIPFNLDRFQQHFLQEFYKEQIYEKYLNENVLLPIPLPIPPGFNPTGNQQITVRDNYIHIKTAVKYVQTV